MKGHEVFIILEFFDEFYKKPDDRLSTRRLKEYSYAKWAIYEIIDRIYENQNEQIMNVLNDFIKKMSVYSMLNRNTSCGFETARNVGIDLYDYISAMKGDQ